MKCSLALPSVCGALAGAALLLTSTDAAAQLEPSTRPWLAELGLGPSIFLTACPVGGGADCAGIAVTQFKLTQIIGGHPGGDGEGFGIGLGLSEAFGSGVFRFQPGMRLWGDIPVADDLAIYISPYGHLGYALWDGFGTAHFFNWTLGVGARIVLADRATISFHPIGLDFHINDEVFAMWYDLMFGFGVTF